MGPFILPTRMDIFCKRRLVFFSALTVINEELMLFFPIEPYGEEFCFWSRDVTWVISGPVTDPLIALRAQCGA